MRIYLAELIDKETGKREQRTDDVNLVLFYGHHRANFGDLAGEFNDLDHRTSGGAPIRIDPNDPWQIKIIGVSGDPDEASIITFNVANS